MGRSLNEVGAQTIFLRAASWYLGREHPWKPRIFMPYTGGVGAYRQRCDEIAARGYAGFTLSPGRRRRNRLSPST